MRQRLKTLLQRVLASDTEAPDESFWSPSGWSVAVTGGEHDVRFGAKPEAKREAPRPVDLAPTPRRAA